MNSLLIDRTRPRVTPLARGRGLHDELTRRRFFGALGATLVLAGCAAPAPPTTPSAEPQTREITDALGTVTIPANPKRVIADSVSTFAHLVALGIEPVGVAIPEGIPTSYFRPAGDTITNVVAEDGWTIDIEKALGLEPDLILGGAADWNNDNLARYKKAVATYAFEEGWKDTEHVYAQFRELAGNIGRADQAEAAIAGYEAKLTAGKAAVAPQVPKLGRVGVIRLADDGWIGARTAEKGHLTSTILRSLGISEPDWPKAGKDEDYLKLSEETLEIVNVADTLFIEANVRFADHPIPKSALWKRLRPVKDGNVYVFETTWYNSDLLQLGSIVDEIVTAVTTRG